MDKLSKKIQVLFHAYIDGRLDDSVRVKFERFLRKKPSLSRELAKYQVIDQHIKDTFEGLAEKPIPNRYTNLIDNYGTDETKLNNLHRWRDKLKQLIPSQMPAPGYVIAVCALLSGFIIGQLVPLGTTTSQNIQSIIEQLAVDAHLIYADEKRHAVEVAAKDKTHLMKWLSARLESKVGPVELKKHEFKLMGGRLLPSLGEHAAFYMYKNNKDERLTLYIRKSEQMESYSEIHCKQDILDTAICSWTGEKLVYFLISKSPADKLSDIAHSTHKQLKK